MVVLLQTQKEEKNVGDIKREERIYFIYLPCQCLLSYINHKVLTSKNKKAKDRTLLIANGKNLQENHTQRSLPQGASPPLSL